jgi:6-phosphogluconolactonase (cycloisomerase 2 family)
MSYLYYFLSYYVLTFLEQVSQPLAFHPVLGKVPRSFGISPCGGFLLVACQDSHEIRTWAIDPETGLLIPTPHAVHVGSPVCICFASAPGAPNTFPPKDGRRVGDE